ncbi:MAG: TetR/AcrR family transcriptional regulator [Bacteroidota bacterium]
MSASTRTGEHILSVAIRLFAEYGYAVTTQEDIAKEAGVAKGLVSYFFHGKEGILLAALKEVKEELAHICHFSEALTPPQQLDQLVDSFCQSYKEKYLLWKMYIPLTISENTREWTRFQAENEFQKLYRPLLHKLLSSLGHQDVDRNILQFEAMRKGALLMCLEGEETISIQHIAENWKALFQKD